MSGIGNNVNVSNIARDANSLYAMVPQTQSLFNVLRNQNQALGHEWKFPSYLTEQEKISLMSGHPSDYRLNSFFAVVARKMPNTFDEFMQMYLDLFIQVDVKKEPRFTDYVNRVTSNVEQAFFVFFQSQVGMSEIEEVLGRGLTDRQRNNQFQAAFASFLQNFPNGNIKNANDFLTNWGLFLASPVSLRDQGNGKESFESFFINNVGNDPEAFNRQFTQFYNDTVARYGYFTPGQNFNEWKTFVQSPGSLPSNNDPQVVGAGAPSRISAEKARVINNILLLLMELMQSINQMAAAYSDRLINLTELNRAYTAQAAKVPFFSSGDGTAIDGTRPDDQLAVTDRYRDSSGNIFIRAWYDSTLRQDVYLRFDGNAWDWANHPPIFQGTDPRNMDQISQIAPLMWRTNDRYPDNALPGSTRSASELDSKFFVDAGKWKDPEGDHGDSRYRVTNNERRVFIERANGNMWIEIMPGQFKAFELSLNSSLVTLEKIHTKGGPEWTGEEGRKRMTEARQEMNQRSQIWLNRIQANRDLVTQATRETQSRMDSAVNLGNEFAASIRAFFDTLRSAMRTISR